MEIIYAGYGAKKTYNVTDQLKHAYAHGQKKFEANNKTWLDPDVGNDKCLFVVYKDASGNICSVAATEHPCGNVHYIELP